MGCFEKILDLGLAQTCWVRIFQGGTQESILGSGSQCAWHSSENVHRTWQGPLPVMSITESPVPAPQQEWHKCLLSPCADTSWCNCPDLSNCLFTMSSTVCLPQTPFCSLNKHTTHVHSAQSLLTLCSQSASLLCLFGYRSRKVLVHVLCGVCMCWLLSHVWLCDPMDCSPPGSSVQGLFLTWVSHIADRFLTIWTKQGSPMCYPRCH